MSAEPDFIAQTDEPRNSEDRIRWFVSAGMEGELNHGCQYFRYSYHPLNHNCLLVEGRKERPVEQGPIRWQFTYAKSA